MARTDLLNGEDIIDSRDIIERIEELEATKEEWAEAHGARASEYTPETMPEEWTDDLEEELTALKEAADEGAASPDWVYGETLIHSSYFEDYCRELVVDCGYLPSDLPGFIEVDWEATADNLRHDYFEVELAGDTYLIRA